MNINTKTNADKTLVEKALAGLERLYTGFADNQALVSRAEHELQTIIDMGFADYFLIVQDFLDIGRKAGHMPEDRLSYLKGNISKMSVSEMVSYIEQDMSMPGMTIGLGRGSAAGSIIAYALGITSIDPISNGLLFERFLNPERVSMPDVDSDFSKSEFEYGVRDIAIEYVAKKYGYDGICGITTPSTLAPKAAIESVARILGNKAGAEFDDKDKRKADTAKAYLRLADSIKKCIPDDPKVSFRKGADKPLGEELREKFSENQEALEVIELAEKLEGVNVNYGKHACGIIISDNGDIGEYAPLMVDNAEGGWKIQLDAEQAEESGLLKMDFLGLKNLNQITKTIREVYKNTGEYIEPLNLPQEPDVYAKVFAKGYTQAVFQFESQGMKKMLKRFKPDCFDDIVLLVACYRPGPMQYLDGIIARKHHEEAPENAVTRIAGYHKDFNDIVAPTYMALVYQEQIMQVFRMVGYSMGGADNVRRAMGHKKEDILRAEKQAFVYGDAEREIPGAIAKGISEEDALALFEEMIEFAKYSFNKSHAAAYAMTSYITAWLKLYHPMEYYSSVLSCTDIEKYPELISEAKVFGVSVKGPDVNISKANFTGYGKEIYFGLAGIKGLGKDAEDITGGYTSIADFITKTMLGRAKIKLLMECGAFDRFCPNRQALLKILPTYMDEVDSLKKERKKLQTAKDMLNDLAKGKEIDRNKYKITTKSLPTKKKLEDKVAELTQKVKEIENLIQEENIPVSRCTEDLAANLKAEKDLLGIYISGHPADLYGTPANHGAVAIVDAELDKTAKIFGLITSGRVTYTRGEDRKPLFFFQIEDNSGVSIDCACFSAVYESNAQIIESIVDKIDAGEPVAVTVTGRKTLNKKEGSDAEEVYQFILATKNSIALVHKKMNPYTAVVEGTWELTGLLESLKPYQTPDGHKVVVYNECEGREETLKIKVSDEALKAGLVTE